MHVILPGLLMMAVLLGSTSSLWASAIGGQQLDEAPAVTDRPISPRNVPDEISIVPDYDGDSDAEYNPGFIPRNPPPGPLPPLPPRQQEALDASKAEIREKYNQEKKAIYETYLQELNDHRQAMDEESKKLEDEIEDEYGEKRDAIKEQQQAELSDAKTTEEKRKINAKYKKELRLLALAKKTEKGSVKHFLSKKNKDRKKALKEKYKEARDKALYKFRRDIRMGTRTPEYQEAINTREF